MTKPTGTAAELLDLPSGGGSVAGQGAGFTVDLNTGTGTAAFELTVPAGPNGIAPTLTLGYATTSGAGPFGLGWSLGFATITRRITPSADAPDPASTGYYSLLGSGDLVDMGAGRYRPTVDTTGLLIVFEDGYWTLTDAQDNAFTLGSTAAAQLGDGTPGDPPAAWMLDRYRDSQGNAIAYSWLPDGGSLLPGTIGWGTYQVVFQYEDRPDLIVNGQLGAPVTISKRCSSIELHVTTEAQSLVRSWTLIYEDDNGRGRSLLAAIREQGHAADGTVLTAPDRTFAYTAPRTPVFAAVSGWVADLTDPDTDLVDLNGDGLPDLLRLGGAFPTAGTNLGGGAFGSPQVFERVPAPLSLGSPNVAFADMSGLGNVDLLVLDQELAGYYPLSVPQDGSGPSGFGFPVVFTNAPGVAPADPRVRLLDLNGDGITDVLFDTGRGWLEFLREDLASWSETPRLLARSVTPPVYLIDPHVYLADMTGDGITDIVRITGGTVVYWPGRADGGWGEQISMTPSPSFARDYDPARMNLVDVDGDGCADLVYVDSGSVTLWRNVGAGQLAEPVVISCTPLATVGTYRLVDLLGSGTPGILYQLPQVRPGQLRQTFLDLSGGVKAYLMSGYADGPCQSTNISYQTSTAYAVADAQAGSPWQTYHPFPVQCVSRTDQTDEATGIISSALYTYHDARYDPVSRTFLGFSAVECDQLGDATCPTLRTATTFHVGLDPADPSAPLYGNDALVQGALRRRMLSTTTYGLDGSSLESSPYSVTRNTYDARLVASSLDGGDQVAVPYLATTVEERWERQSAAFSTRTIENLTVDDEGNITSQRTVAQRTGVSAPDQDVTTTTTFASGGVNLTLPARITQTAADGTVIAASVTYYDGPGYTGLAEGQATEGLISRVEQLAFTDTFAAAVWGTTPPDLTQYGYHRLPGDTTGWWLTPYAYQRQPGTATAGPKLSVQGSLGGVHTAQYDTAGQRVITVTDPMGNASNAVTDPRVWQTESVTDANGNTGSDVFDALGRVTATVGPGDTTAMPLFAYAYEAAAVSTILASARIEHGQAATFDSLTWIAGSGQTLGKAEPSATPGQWTVTGSAAYNIRGLPAAAYVPYPVTGNAWQAAPAGTAAAIFAYDALGRVVQLTRPDGLVIRTSRVGGTVTISEQWPGGAAQDVEQQTYDAAGQLLSVRRNDGGTWVGQSYTYTPTGRVATVTLADGLVATLQEDLLGRRFGYQSPDSGATVWLLDACNNPRLRTNAAGGQVRTEVDASNRVTEVFYDAEPTPRTAYSYLDQGDPAPSGGAANRYGRVWQVTDELGTESVQYDEAGRITVTQRVLAAADGQSAQTFTQTQAYDAMGRTTSVTLPPTVSGAAGRTVDYAYGPDGYPSSASGIVETAVYDLFGRPVSLGYANGASTQITYRPDGGGISRVQVTDSSGTVLRDVTASWSQAFVTGLSSAVGADDSVAFGYDRLRRLTSAQYSNTAGSLDGHTWAYDEGFRVTADSDAPALVYRAGSHQLASVGGTATVYDAAGRMVSGTYGTLSFDAGDRLASVTTPSGVAIAHTYDFNGRRARTLTAGVQSYLSPLPALEIRGSSTVAWIAFGGVSLAAEVDGALWFLHANALGGADLATDAAGGYAFRLQQSPYGLTRPDQVAPTAAAALALAALLTGTDPSGLVCRGLRWYDPKLGQFVSPDPFVSGPFTLGAWNPYVYCLGNPVALTDPTGGSFWSVLAMIGIAVLASCLALVTVGFASIGMAALGVTISTTNAFATWTLISIGTFGASLSGEIAAQKAGGNLWAGALVGALLGGVTSYAGAVLGAASATALNAGAAAGYHSVLSFVISGLYQGITAGAGTGLAVGFAGGKGSLDSMMSAMIKGMAWGAGLGALLGFGLGMLVGGTGPDNYINFCSLGEKFAKPGDAWTVYQDADNLVNGMQSAAQLYVPGGGGPSLQNIGGFLTNFVSTGVTKSGITAISIPISSISTVVLQDGTLSTVVNASMLADQLGFSYASQFLQMMGIAPIADVIFAQIQMNDPAAINAFSKAMNALFESDGSDSAPAEPLGLGEQP